MKKALTILALILFPTLVSAHGSHVAVEHDSFIHGLLHTVGGFRFLVIAIILLAAVLLTKQFLQSDKE